MPLDPRLLELLVCPACRTALAEQDRGLRCVACGRLYPVRDGIPVLLVDEAVLDGDASGPKF